MLFVSTNEESAEINETKENARQEIAAKLREMDDFVFDLTIDEVDEIQELLEDDGDNNDLQYGQDNENCPGMFRMNIFPYMSQY